MNKVIEFGNVTKIYRLGSRSTIREAFSSLIQRNLKDNNRSQQTVKSLNNVSFTVNEGEVLGIIGANGAGKTTILKLLSRVSYPTSGNINVKGRLSALIELGAGFHPELTGAENIYLNGAILGLKKEEIDHKFSEILEFSGLNHFINTPVKRYSSGMYARLAFSVAAHVDPDILLVDEVLSVGDELFQQKCFNRMRQIRDMGRAMVFISHNMMAVKNICNRVIWLDKGEIKQDGDPDDVIGNYLLSQQVSIPAKIEDFHDGQKLDGVESDEIKVQSILIEDEFGNEMKTLQPGSPIKVKIILKCIKDLKNLHIQVYLDDKNNERIIGDRLSINRCADEESKNIEISCLFTSTINRPNIYRATVDLFINDELIFRKKGVGPIIVLPDKEYIDMYHYELVKVPTRWYINGNEIR